jgi:ABC-type glycerol-3-phosphate transport system substrate-binding protein
VFNDASADIAAGKITPEQAANAVEKSWQQNKQ